MEVVDKADSRQRDCDAAFAHPNAVDDGSRDQMVLEEASNAISVTTRRAEVPSPEPVTQEGLGMSPLKLRTAFDVSSAAMTLKKKGHARAKSVALYFSEKKFQHEVGKPDEFCKGLPKTKLTYDDLFGDRLPPSQFSFSIFIFEFFTQLLHPLLLPVVLKTQGSIAAQNKGYTPLPGKQQLFIGNTFNSVMGFAPQIIAIGAQARWAGTFLIVSECFVFFRYLVIAGKYASYRHRDYVTLLHKRGSLALDKLLVANWRTIRQEVIDAEFKEAQERFALSSISTSSLKLASGQCVSAETYLSILLREKFGAAPPKWFDYFLGAVSVAMSLLPVWVYLTEFGVHHADPVGIVLVALGAFQFWVYAPTVVNFLWIGYLTYARQLECLEALLHAIIRSGSVPEGAIEWESVARAQQEQQQQQEDDDDKNGAPSSGPLREDERERTKSGQRSGTNDDGAASYDFFEGDDPEKRVAPETMFSLKVTSNVEVFDKMRKLLRRFGFGYLQRISFNTFATAFVLTFLVLTLLQQAMSTNTDWKIFTFVIVTFGVCAAIVLATLFAASAINEIDDKFVDLIAHEEHAVMQDFVMNEYSSSAITLATAGSSLQQQSQVLLLSSSSGIGEAAAAAAAAAATSEREMRLLRDLLSSLRLCITQSRLVDPVKVMYLPAKSELITAFMGLLFSALLVALQIGTAGGKNLSA